MPAPARSGCLVRLLILLIVVPLAEMALLLVLARYTNIWTALLAVVVMGVAGSLLVKAQGWRTMQRIGDALRQGRLPTDSLWDAAMVCCAGVLLLTPGILTDLMAVALLIPWSRNMARRYITGWVRRHAVLQSWTGGPHSNGESQVIDSYVIDPSEPND